DSKIPVRQKLGYGFLLCVMFFSMYIKPVDMWWHGGQVPNWLPYRYSFIISFLLLSTAATSFRQLAGMKRSSFTGTFVGILVVVLYLQGREYTHLGDISSVWLTIGLAAAYLIFLFYIGIRKETRTLTVIIAIVISGELLFNAVHSLRALDKEVTYSTKESYENFMENGRKAVNVMEERDSGLYRSEKTFTRCINDNCAWGLKGLTHSSSVMNSRILAFIETLGYNARSYYTRYEGTTELADSLLGIKYVIDRDNAREEQALANAQGSTELEKIDLRRRWLLHEAYPEVDRYSFTDQEGNAQTYTIHENPNALPIAYMVSDDLKLVDHLGNDNPFNSQNVFLSTLTGHTEFTDEGKFASFREYYTRIRTEEPVLGAVTLSDYNGQACYTKMATGDPTVDYRFTVDNEQEIFCFLKTDNEQAVNLWLGVYDETSDSYRFGTAGYGQYFETSNYSIISLGKFTPGTKVSLRLTVREKDGATIIKEPYFYYFDRDAFQQDMDILKRQGMEVTKFSSTAIKGTVYAKEGQLLFTTIPYEPGWTVRVDGVTEFTTGSSDTVVIKHKDKSGKTWKEYKEKHLALKSMIYVPLTPGEHTIELTYSVPGLVPGLFLQVLGIVMMAILWLYDRKYNFAVEQLLRKRKAAKTTDIPQQPQEPEVMDVEEPESLPQPHEEPEPEEAAPAEALPQQTEEPEPEEAVPAESLPQPSEEPEPEAVESAEVLPQQTEEPEPEAAEPAEVLPQPPEEPEPEEAVPAEALPQPPEEPEPEEAAPA
ncbi:MAG: YfhO family protein, partial [Oscillospiraceae bacterium]|nr:YfhO family protein [Oscillospiraceae bacterium]